VILLVIDVQAGLDDPRYGERSDHQCEEKIVALLNAFRNASHPVIYTRHFSLRPGSRLAPDNPGSEIKAEVAPSAGERVFTKTTNSAFKNAEFCAALAASGTRELVLAGIATDACVTATAREAKDLGYRVTVVSDACATFARPGLDGERYPAALVNGVSLAALAGSGMRVCASATILQEVCDSEHDRPRVAEHHFRGGSDRFWRSSLSCASRPDHSREEERLLLLGRATSGRLLIVAFTDRGDTLRIISARAMTSRERRAHEHQT
jgi:nicotinamidase-related amidase/uncharacterized DUF497 family protein